MAKELKTEQTEDLAPLRKQARQMALNHKHERNHLQRFHGKRQARYNKGIRGLLDRITGKHTTIRKQNETEAWQNRQRDKKELDQLIISQIDKRKLLQVKVNHVKKQHMLDREKLAQDIGDALKFEGRKAIIKRQIERDRELDHDQLIHDFEI